MKKGEKRFYDLLHGLNGILIKQIINLGYDRVLLKQDMKEGVKAYIRPFSLDFIISREIFNNVYRVDIQEGDKVIDGGAHAGFFSLYCLSKGARVVAVEPNLENLNLLRLNLALNAFKDYEVFEGALWPESGLVRLLQTRNAGNHSIIGYGSHESVRYVRSIDIADLLPCDVLKLDIEGAEYRVVEKTPLEEVHREIAIEYHMQGELKARKDWLFNRIRNAGFTVDYEREYPINGYLHASR